MRNDTPRVRLEILEVRNPCPADWDGMRAVDDRTRFCRHCDKHVYDLSAMTREAAERFVGERLGAGGEACVRMTRRADGTVASADCAGAWRRAGRRVRAGWALALAVPALVAAAIRPDRGTAQAEAPQPVKVIVPPFVTLGRLAPPVPTTVPSDPPTTRAAGPAEIPG